jgi:sugar/nucleoside kinase (ribokinase family)
MARVMVAGSTNFDIITATNRMPNEHEKLRSTEYMIAVGGSACNTARGVAQCGIETSLVSAVGCDMFGDICLTRLHEARVDTTYVMRIPNTATGLAIIFSSGHSKRMLTFAGPNRDPSYDAITPDEIENYSHLHVAGASSPSLARLVKCFSDAGKTISVEWNGNDMFSLAPYAKFHFMNSDEICQVFKHEAASAGSELSSELSSELAHRTGGNIIVTMGPEGAIWTTPSGQSTRERTTPVEPVDRTGGGDAFNAGVVAAIVQWYDESRALRMGLDNALEAIMRKGE